MDQVNRLLDHLLIHFNCQLNDLPSSKRVKRLQEKNVTEPEEVNVISDK